MSVDREIAILEKPLPPWLWARMVFLSTLGWATVFVNTLLFSVLTILASLFDKSGRLGHATCARNWARSILFMVGVKLRVRGLEHLDPDRAYVLTANHLSLFDVLVLLAGLPIQFRWMAKKEVFAIPLMGWAMARVGYVSIDRENKEKAWAHLYQAKGKLEEGYSLMFFPEGTRSPDGELKRFKSGAFVLALHAGVPVAPVSIAGTREIMPKKSVLFHPGTVDLLVSPPVEPDGFSLERKEEYVQAVRGLMAAELEKIRMERVAQRLAGGAP